MQEKVVDAHLQLLVVAVHHFCYLKGLICKVLNACKAMENGES